MKHLTQYGNLKFGERVVNAYTPPNETEPVGNTGIIIGFSDYGVPLVLTDRDHKRQYWYFAKRVKK
jgi:hypothetical protein